MSLNYQAYQTKQFCKVSSYLGSPYPGQVQHKLFSAVYSVPLGTVTGQGRSFFLQVRLLQDDKAIVLELEIIPGQLVAQDRYLFKGPDPFPGNCPVVWWRSQAGSKTRSGSSSRRRMISFSRSLAPGRNSRTGNSYLIASRGDAQGGSGGFPFPTRVSGETCRQRPAADENTAW